MSAAPMTSATMPMTAAERAAFDMSGFLVRPAVLDTTTVSQLRDAVDRMQHQPETLPTHERRCPGGSTSLMIDHPSVLGVLHEVLGGAAVGEDEPLQDQELRRLEAKLQALQDAESVTMTELQVLALAQRRPHRHVRRTAAFAMHR